MGCDVRNQRLHDTVTDTIFGPLCASDEEAELLRYQSERTRGHDPRALDRAVLDEVLAEIRSGAIEVVPTHRRKQCGCDNGKPYEEIMSREQVTYTKCADGHPWVAAPEAGWL